MIYLISQIWIGLAIAAGIGFLAGWWMRAAPIAALEDELKNARAAHDDCVAEKMALAARVKQLTSAQA